MATVADLLDAMSLINNELEVGLNDRQEIKAILALKHTQHWFETLVATYPKILQDIVNVSSVANTETTPFTSNLLRIDGAQYLDPNGVPIGNMLKIDDIGGHVPSLPLPLSLVYAPGGGGQPFGYYANMNSFFWFPKPDGVYSFRIYGFFEADEFDPDEGRDAVFEYPNRLILPFATFATKLMQIAVDDDKTDLETLAVQTFRPTIHQLRKFDRSAPVSRYYTEFHTT